MNTDHQIAQAAINTKQHSKHKAKVTEQGEKDIKRRKENTRIL